MRSLENRTAIVTGASRGIGRHIALALAGRGCNVVLAARSAADLERVAGEIAARGGKAAANPTDVADAASRERLLAEAERRFGPVEVLVNNAGVEDAAEFVDLTPAEIAGMVEVNLVAPMLLVRAVLPAMLARGSGWIVNIASLAGRAGAPFGEPYSASKFGLIGFTQSLRASYRGSGVHFSAVLPGFISGEGMYARQARDGLRAPRVLGAAPPEDVAAGVLAAIDGDRAEVVVNPTPVRPLFALGALFPRLGEHVAAGMGVTRFFRGVAERRRQERRAGR